MVVKSFSVLSIQSSWFNLASIEEDTQLIFFWEVWDHKKITSTMYQNLHHKMIAKYFNFNQMKFRAGSRSQGENMES